MYDTHVQKLPLSGKNLNKAVFRPTFNGGNIKKCSFSHSGKSSKILKNARIPDSVLGYPAAVGVTLEESTKAKTAFKNGKSYRACTVVHVL